MASLFNRGGRKPAAAPPPVDDERLNIVAAQANQRLAAYLEMMARAEAAIEQAAGSPIGGSPSCDGQP